MRLRQVLAARAFALEEVGHGVQPQAVDAHIEPEINGPEQRSLGLGVVEVQVRLVGVEPMPVVRLGDRVPGPVRRFEVLEDDPRALIAVGRVAPDVEVAPAAVRVGPAGALEPRVLVGGVVQDQLRDHAQAAVVGLAQERCGSRAACRSRD